MYAILSKRKLLSSALALVALLAVGIAGWSIFGPVDACADPACARQRFLVQIEVDSFRTVQPIALELTTAEHAVALESILASGGVAIKVDHDQTHLPYTAASGPLDRADLHQYAQAWRGLPVPAGAHAGIYAIMTPALISDQGEPMFGIMFDTEGREGFAIAPGETVRAFKDRNDESIALLQLRTFAHELLHALNRRHLDAMQLSDGRLTIEAPTRCISVADGTGRWSLVEEPLMAISPQTIRFFQTAAPRDVLPGAAYTPYEQLRTSATECDDVRRNAGATPALTRWEFVRKRLWRLLSFQSAYAQERADESAKSGADEAPRVELHLQAQPAPYPLGYPIAVRVMALNLGPSSLPLRDRLTPSYGMIQIERRPAGEEEWQALKPLALYEPASDEGAMLESGERTEETVPIYFGEDGWTFPQVGAYEVRARLAMSEQHADAASNIVEVHIAAPEAADDQAALQPLLDANERLDEKIGRLLTLGGRIGSDADILPLEAISQTHGHTALGSALRLTLVSQQLNPAIDPRTGERPQPEIGAARELLRDTCTDSGVAALKDLLLDRFDDAAPAEVTPGSNSNASAWDGVTAARETIATYSDPALRRYGPSLHFCFDDAAISGQARTSARQLARQLRRAKPQRVVVVGHTDREGRCRYNDSLALRRADAMRRMLIDAGVASDQIQTASLGERRPLDFSATEEAGLLNRRIEVLAQGDSQEPASTAQRSLPRCRASSSR
ncbi:MAG: OmpA family protein [Steroidobacter sp.]